jgi:membrane protease subunit (stomatin/prohibitin family)
MSILDNVFNRVKSDLEYRAGSEISSKVSKKAGEVLDKDKANVGKCPKCKKPVQSGLKFCTNCGAKLVLSCAKCSIDYPVGTKFCAQCGEAVK